MWWQIVGDSEANAVRNLLLPRPRNWSRSSHHRPNLITVKKTELSLLVLHFISSYNTSIAFKLILNPLPRVIKKCATSLSIEIDSLDRENNIPQGFNLNRCWHYTIMVAARVWYAPKHNTRPTRKGKNHSWCYKSFAIYQKFNKTNGDNSEKICWRS